MAVLSVLASILDRIEHETLLLQSAMGITKCYRTYTHSELEVKSFLNPLKSRDFSPDFGNSSSLGCSIYQLTFICNWKIVSAALKGVCFHFVVGLSYPFLKDSGINCLVFRRRSIVVLLTDWKLDGEWKSTIRATLLASLVGWSRIALFHAARQDTHKRARRVRLLSGVHKTDARRRAALTRSRGGPYRKRVTRGIFAGCEGTVLSRRKKRPGLPTISATILCPL